MRSALSFIGVSVLLATGACGNEMTLATPVRVPTLEDIDRDRWQALAERRFFFGHQSVGGNILAGVQEVLADHPEIALRIVETDDPTQMSMPALYHANIGANEAPLTKLRAFESIASHGEIASSGAAILKYCYLDVTPDLDPVAFFEEYRRTVDGLRADHPGLTVVHVTMPLTTDPGWLRHVAARVRGRLSGREKNYIRERYNTLLRSTYEGREPVFDLARYESIGPDGRVRAVEFRDEAVPVLAREWTNDGGHLNEVGRRRIAVAFLASLATI